MYCDFHDGGWIDMYREDLKLNAEKEMIDLIDQNLQQFDSNTQTAESVYSMLKRDGFITISAPEEERLVNLFIGPLDCDKKGASIKSGNLVLNMRNNVLSIPKMAIEGQNILNGNLIHKIVAGIALWKELRSTIEIKVTKEHAFLMVALWENCNNEQRISTDRGLECVNKLLEMHEIEPLSKKKYWELLGFLEDIDSIEIDNEVIWLREWVSRKYKDSLLSK